MRKMTAIVAIAVFCGSLALAAEEEDRGRKEPEPTYESPVLSLLFLPVNLLIKMASVFGPDSTSSAGRQNRPTTTPPPAK